MVSKSQEPFCIFLTFNNSVTIGRAWQRIFGPAGVSTWINSARRGLKRKSSKLFGAKPGPAYSRGKRPVGGGQPLRRNLNGVSQPCNRRKAHYGQAVHPGSRPGGFGEAPVYSGYPVLPAQRRLVQVQGQHAPADRKGYGRNGKDIVRFRRFGGLKKRGNCIRAYQRARTGPTDVSTWACGFVNTL